MLVGMGLFSITSRASAEIAYADAVEWRAPEGCPDATALGAAVERLLLAPLPDARVFKATASVTLDEDKRFTLVLSVRTAHGKGTRTLRADSCEELSTVAAFGIVLAFNPALGLTTWRRAPATSLRDEAAEIPPGEGSSAAPLTASLPRSALPERTPFSAVPEPSALAAAPESSRLPALPESSRPATELRIGAHALVDTSLLPNPASGLGASLDLSLRGAIAIGLGGQLLIPQMHYLDGGSGGRFSFAALDVHACWQERFGIQLAACPTFLVGRLRGEGRGVSQVLAQKSDLFAPGLTVLGSSTPPGRTSLVLGASGLFPLRRDVFLVKAGPVHEVPVFSLQLWIGVALRAF